MGALVIALFIVALPATATEIVSVEWLPDGFIEVLFDAFPPWNDWTMYIDGERVSMHGPPGDVNVRPNGPVHSATGVFIGTDPWVTSLEDVEFPCEGELHFHIPGQGPTNSYAFSLREAGCCTALDCGGYKEELADWGEGIFNPQLASGIPFNAPAASLITFGEPNALGEVSVTGAASAALPGSLVYFVNLSSTHQSYTTAEEDGSFSATLFAPPGSPVMVKHGPRYGEHAHRWHDLERGIAEGVNPLPGTILHVPFDTEATSSGIPFSAAGAFELDADFGPTATNVVRSAWSLEGTMAGMMGVQETYAPYETLLVTGTLRIHSQAIDASTRLSSVRVHSGASLLLLQTADGHDVPVRDNFMSRTLTPTGFPIQGGHEPSTWEVRPHIDIGNLRFIEPGLAETSFRAQLSIPGDLPPGRYRPVLWIEAENVPGGSEWVSAYVVRNTYSERQAPLPVIDIVPFGSSALDTPRLNWRLLMENFSLGTRGTGALEDEDAFAVSSQIVTQGAAYIVPPIDEQTGLPIEYRLEPFLPTISFTDRRMPTPPRIPLELPGGQLTVTITEPDGTTTYLGDSEFAQSFNRSSTTRSGGDVNNGTVQLEDVYSLMVDEETYRVTFDQYGLHKIRMTGWVSDIWGNRYEGGGTYEVWVARPLDMDFGTLPGTPLEVGDAWNPMLTVHPRVPADVEISITQAAESDASRISTTTITGTANDHGTFAPEGAPVTANDHGEYRVDVFASYTDETGMLYAGAATWGGVIMTPAAEAQLVAHGRRGLDSIDYIPNHWFVAERDLTFPDGAISHTLNPYYNGDILWSGEFLDPVGASLVLGASVQDTVGLIEMNVLARTRNQHVETYAPGSLESRLQNGEIPLFISTTTGRSDQLYPSEIDQIAYSYGYSERPGVRVREVITEDSESGGYWRLDTLYDDQLGVGVLGDRPNDFKFQYVGTVFRDLANDHVEYGGQGSGWVFIDEDDPLGPRAMPPFAGPGNGGWTTEGGPIMTLDGEEIHLFILPTGIRPGSILEVGETARFAGHIMPTLESKVEVTITAPSGATQTIGGQANRIGYFYDAADDFVVDDAGVWTADVRVWHDGVCSGGATVQPYPSGNVLGSVEGRFAFYVVPVGATAIEITSPNPGFLTFPHHEVTSIRVRGKAAGAATVHYTISIPGFLLDEGELNASNGSFTLTFDPESLHGRFPNLDLSSRDSHEPGLADTISIALFAEGSDGSPLGASTLTLQGNQVFLDGND